MIVSNWAKKVKRAYKFTAYPKVFRPHAEGAFFIYLNRSDGRSMGIKLTRDQWDQLVEDVEEALA